MLSKVELDSDILQPIPLEEWPLLQNFMKQDWPINANYYYWIENAIQWKKQKPDLPLQIYCPNGEYKDDWTFLGIITISYCTVTAFTKEESGKRLYEALVKSKRFDWSKGVTFCGIHEHIQTIVNAALATLKTTSGVEILEDLPGRFRIKSAAECAKVKIKVPDDCYLADLNSSHLPVINSVWPHRDRENPENSIKALRPSVTLNKSLGLFLKEGDVLVSWALHSDWHGLGAVQTLDAYKRRGYAKTVVNALAKQLGERGISPILSVVCGNTPSENMFGSLGWKPFKLVTWITAIKRARNVD